MIDTDLFFENKMSFVTITLKASGHQKLVYQPSGFRWYNILLTDGRWVAMLIHESQHHLVINTVESNYVCEEYSIKRCRHWQCARCYNRSAASLPLDVIGNWLEPICPRLVALSDTTRYLLLCGSCKHQRYVSPRMLAKGQPCVHCAGRAPCKSPDCKTCHKPYRIVFSQLLSTNGSELVTTQSPSIQTPSAVTPIVIQPSLAHSDKIDDNLSLLADASDAVVTIAPKMPSPVGGLSACYSQPLPSIATLLNIHPSMSRSIPQYTLPPILTPLPPPSVSLSQPHVPPLSQYPPPPLLSSDSQSSLPQARRLSISSLLSHPSPTPSPSPSSQHNSTFSTGSDPNGDCMIVEVIEVEDPDPAEPPAKRRKMEVSNVCTGCSHPYRPTNNSIFKEGECPYCTNLKLCNSDDCRACLTKSFAISTLAVHLVSKTKNPRAIFRWSTDNYLFRCPDCKHYFKKSIKSVMSGLWCPYCTEARLCTEDGCEPCYNNCALSINTIYRWSSENVQKGRTVHKNSTTRYLFECVHCRATVNLTPRMARRRNYCQRCDRHLATAPIHFVMETV